MFELNRESPLPLYYQVKQSLLNQIQKGLIGPGDPVPTEKELQEAYGVSRITVRRALADLSSAGYIARHAGKGTFVIEPKVKHFGGKIGGFTEDLVAQGFHVESRVIEYDEQPVPHEVSLKLGVPENLLLPRVRKIIIANHEPIALGTIFLNLGPDKSFSREELERASTIALLKQKYDMDLDHAERITEATVALGDEAKLLHVRRASPLLLVSLLVFDDKNKGIIYVKSLYRGDRYRYCQTISQGKASVHSLVD